MKHAINIKEIYSDRNTAGVLLLEGLTLEALEKALIYIVNEEDYISSTVYTEKLYSLELEPITSNIFDRLDRDGGIFVSIISKTEDGDSIKTRLVLELTELLGE